MGAHLIGGVLQQVLCHLWGDAAAGESLLEGVHLLWGDRLEAQQRVGELAPRCPHESLRHVLRHLLLCSRLRGLHLKFEFEFKVIYKRELYTLSLEFQHI